MYWRWTSSGVKNVEKLWEEYEEEQNYYMYICLIKGKGRVGYFFTYKLWPFLILTFVYIN